MQVLLENILYYFNGIKGNYMKFINETVDTIFVNRFMIGNIILYIILPIILCILFTIIVFIMIVKIIKKNIRKLEDSNKFKKIIKDIRLDFYKIFLDENLEEKIDNLNYNKKEDSYLIKISIILSFLANLFINFKVGEISNKILIISLFCLIFMLVVLPLIIRQSKKNLGILIIIMVNMYLIYFVNFINKPYKFTCLGEFTLSFALVLSTFIPFSKYIKDKVIIDDNRLEIFLGVYISSLITISLEPEYIFLVLIIKSIFKLIDYFFSNFYGQINDAKDSYILLIFIHLCIVSKGAILICILKSALHKNIITILDNKLNWIIIGVGYNSWRKDIAISSTYTVEGMNTEIDYLKSKCEYYDENINKKLDLINEVKKEIEELKSKEKKMRNKINQLEEKKSMLEVSNIRYI